MSLVTKTSSLVSVIILNYNGAQHLPTCTESLQVQTLADQLEIIVVDNGSTDDSEQVVRPYGVTFLALGENHGFGKGNNLGARTAAGKYLFFVNNDMRFEPDCVEQMVQVLESDETIFSADARQYSWDGQCLLHAGTAIRPASRWYYQYPGLRFDPRVEVSQPMDIPFGCAGHLMVRKWMFDELKGFDNTFFIDYEDVDLCWRAWLRGWRSLYVPEAVVYHKVGMGFRDEGEARTERPTDWQLFRQYSFMKNQIRFALKVMPLRDNVNIFLRQHVFAVYHVVKGKPYLSPCYLRAWWKNVLELGEIWSARREAFRHAVTSSQAIRQRFWVDDQSEGLFRASPANQLTEDLV